MLKANIALTPAYRDILANSILQLVKLHKVDCDGQCGVILFPIRELIEQLLERPLTTEESGILS